LTAIKEIIVGETQKILNCASSHWPEIQINSLLLAAPALEEKISQIISENFSLSVQKMTLPSKLAAPEGRRSITNNQLPSMTSDWFSALGSALRGLIPRSKDTIISLASTGTEEEFRQHQIINFVRIWRNVALTCLSVIFIAFMVAESFLMQTTNSLNGQLANLANLPEMTEVNKFQAEAQDFNERIELGLQVRSQIYNWSPFFEKVKTLTNGDVTLERIFIQAKETPILINGLAVNEQAIVDFKTRLEEDPEFKEVNLPLSAITEAVGGSLKFSITLRLK
jgi:Tfp pilus assembly protein PilN